MFRYTILLALIAIFAATPAFAQGKEPAEVKAVSVALTATVKSVSGIVERFSGDAKNGKWEAAKAGDILAERSLLRTGLGGRAVLKFADRGDVTGKSGTKVGISSFRKTGKLVKTTLGLKYGALRAQVDSSRGANDFRVRTAAATLAATGTSGNVAQWGDFSLQFQGTTGTWKARTQRKITSIRPGEWTNRKAAKSIGIVLNKLDTKVGDPHGGLTKAETVQLQRNRGAIKPTNPKSTVTISGRRRSRRRAVIRRLRVLLDRASSND